MSDEGFPAAGPSAVGGSPPIAVSRVELIVDNLRVVGDIKQAGVPRRLVDLLNNHDVEFFVVEDGEIDDPFTDGEAPRKLANMEIVRESILFAFPRGGNAPERGDAFETVKKVPVRSTIVIPGFEVRGNVHFIPDIRPEDVPMMQNRHFIPVTDARITATGGHSAEWNEPIAVVNLIQAFVFAVDGGR